MSPQKLPPSGSARPAVPHVTITASLPAAKSAVATTWASGAKKSDLSISTISDPSSTSKITAGNIRFESTIGASLRNVPTSSSTDNVSILTLHALKNRVPNDGNDEASSLLVGQFIGVEAKKVPKDVKAKLRRAIYGNNLNVVDIETFFEGAISVATGSYGKASGGTAWALSIPDKNETNSAIVAYGAGEA